MMIQKLRELWNMGWEPLLASFHSSTFPWNGFRTIIWFPFFLSFS